MDVNGWTLDQPWALLLVVAAIPIAALGFAFLPGLDSIRRGIVIAIRVIVVALLALVLAGPSRITTIDEITVVALADISGSVRYLGELPLKTTDNSRDSLAYMRDWLRKAAAGPYRRVDDRFGIVVFDGRARALTVPTSAVDYDDASFDQPQREGTDISDAIQFGSVLFTPGGSRRIVLFSDGVETSGDAIDALRAAREGRDGVTGAVPIDIVPISYRIRSEVQLARLEVPSVSRPGQRITVRIVVESTAPTKGQVELLLEGSPVDINGPAPGLARTVNLDAGTNVILAETTLRDVPINRFSAVFTPDRAGDDTLPGNNTAEAFTATPGRGSVLVLDGVGDGRGGILPAVFETAGFAVDVRLADELPTNPVELQAFDLVVLQNVSADHLTPGKQESLTQYVESFGGGLVMVGGYEAFGAGGWVDTPVAEILPVDVRVPDELHVPTAAIAIVLDRSGSMRESGGPGRSKQEVANEGAAVAIGTLDASDWITVIAFNESPHVVVPIERVGNSTAAQERVRRIAPNGGTNLGPALRQAVKALEGVEADVKHILCLSDGRSEPDDFKGIVRDLRSKGMTLSAIAVGDSSSGLIHSDEGLLRQMALDGGGAFYVVWNPEILPRIFVKDIRVIRRPMIREKEFVPQLVASTSPIASAISEPVPPLQGFVLTQSRHRPDVSTLMVTPDGFPLLTTWQAGLGRVTAFASDAHNQWAAQWIDWPGYARMWAAIARGTARPAGSGDFELSVSIKDGFVEMILSDAGRAGADTPMASVPGSLFDPTGRRHAIRLRPIAPGLYRAREVAEQSGHYIVALTPQRSDGTPEIVVGGVSQQAGVEYRQLQSNIELLRALADKTGGRVLDAAAPESAGLFDRSDLVPMSGSVALWRPLTLICIALMLVDVALRRIAWSTSGVVRRLGLLMRSPETSTGRTDESGTVDSLRRAVARVGARSGRVTPAGEAPIDSGRAEEARPTDVPDTTAANEEPEDVEDRARAERQEAEAARLATLRRKRALELLSGRSSAKPGEVEGSAKDTTKPEERSSLSSQLLKRRRSRSGENEPDRDSG